MHEKLQTWTDVDPISADLYFLLPNIEAWDVFYSLYITQNTVCWSFRWSYQWSGRIKRNITLDGVEDFVDVDWLQI